MLARAYAQAPLADAAQQGDQAAVRQLLQHKTNVNAAQPDGMTALHWATTRDDVPLAKILLAAGAATSPKTRLGELTPLFIASKRGSAPMIEALLKPGTDANATDSTGATPLMLASAAGSADAVEILLAHHANVNAKESAHQQTALMFAAAADRGAVIRTLIKHGADPEIATITSEPRCGSLFANSFCREAAPGKDNTTPENTTPESDNPPPAQATTKTVVPPRRRKGPAIIGGMTALLYAARDGRSEAVRALVESGAKIDNPGIGEKMTPLVMAIVNGHYDLAMYLLNSGADPNLAGDQGLTPLYATLDEGMGALRLPSSTHRRTSRGFVFGFNGRSVGARRKSQRYPHAETMVPLAARGPLLGRSHGSHPILASRAILGPRRHAPSAQSGRGPQAREVPKA